MILADTGVLFAAADRDDPRHADCVEVVDGHADELVVPTTVVVETAWLIESRLGPAAEAGFVRAVNAGEVARLDLIDDDQNRSRKPTALAVGQGSAPGR